MVVYQPDEILMMSPKLKIIDTKYQLDNNGLFDKGVINDNSQFKR